MQILQGPKKGVRRVAFSPDGRQLAAGSYDRSLRVFDLANGEQRRLAVSSATPLSMAWSPDGKCLYWSWCPFENGGVTSVSLQSEPNMLLTRTADVCGVCPAPDGKRLYVATADTILRWTLKPQLTPLSDWPAESPGCLAVSADGKMLASTHPHHPLAEVDAHYVALWDTRTGREKKRLLECRDFFDGVGFSPDGKRLVAVGHQSIWLWELPSGKPLANHASKKFFTDLAWSPLGTVFATSGNDGEIRFWDGRSGAASGVYSWGLEKALCVAFAPDGMRAAAGDSTGKIVVWDVE